MRAPGMTWFRLPIFVWTIYATSLIFMLAVPVLAMALMLVILERILHIGIFDPALGGDPLLFQHLFWFYSHPAVYIMILPGMGVVSEIIPCFARKKLFGYDFVAYSSFGIACLAFWSGRHHMFVAGISVYAALVFSSLSFLVAVPSAIKVFNWTATLYKGSISLRDADAVCPGFRRPVHRRRPDRPVSGDAGHGHARARHLFRHRPFPFHHGRRHGDGLHGRPALLVAEDDGAHVFGMVVAAGRADHLRGLFPDVPAAVRRRLQRHAAALSPLSAGVPGVERDVVGGRSILAVGYVLPLFYLPLLAPLRKSGRGRIRGARPGWNGRPPRRRRATTSPRRQIVVRGPYEYHLEKARMSLEQFAPHRRTSGPRLALTTRFSSGTGSRNSTPTSSSSTRPPPWMWVFLGDRSDVLRHARSLRLAIYHHQYPQAFEKASHKLNWLIGGINTVVLLVSSLMMVLAVHYAKLGRRKQCCRVLALDGCLGVCLSCASRGWNTTSIIATT